MNEFPEPLTPADCDLSDFAFMPLDVARLRDSGMASDETPEVCWAAVLLWAAAWHQVPAGSIPDNEQWIAKQAGYAQRGRISEDWAAVRDGALRNFVMCADGRLYHPVVAEKAREAWKAKLLQRWRTECARIKKHNDRHPGANVQRPSHEEWLSMGCPAGQPLHVPKDIPHPEQGQGGNVSGETPSKGQGEGQGQGDLYSVPKGTEGNPPPAAPAPPAKPKEMAKAELWRAAVSVLEHGGCPASQCRTFMGKLVQDYDFAVVQQAVANAVTAQPADAREYLRAACMRIKGERPNKQQAMEQRGMTTAKTWAKGGRNA